MAEPQTSLEDLVLAALEGIEARGFDALEELCARHPSAAAALRRRVARLVDCGLVAPPAEQDGGGHEFPERLGDFRLIEPVGGGGMGVVFRAEQVSLGREVALKLVRPEQLFFPGARERFLREVEIVAGLTHPGIVPVHAVGEDDGVPFFAMELVRGATLGDLIEELVRAGTPADRLTGADLLTALGRATGSGDGPVAGTDGADGADGTDGADGAGALFAGSWNDACLALVREVAEALEHAHRRGIIHRDVKPSNVIVTPAGRVMLFDFGLSSSGGADRLTRTGTAIGSIPYMSPEQVESAGEADPRSDVYSLGVTLYELLTLRLPYEEESALALAERIQRGDAAPIGQLRSGVSWEVQTIVATAMDVDPARRYASAADLARDLDHALARRPIEARPAGRLLRARRWIQRHPTRAVSVLAAVLLFVIAPSVFAWREFQSGQVIAGQRDTLARTNSTLASTNEELGRVNADLASTNDRLADALATAESERARAEGNFRKALEAVDRMLQRVGGEVLQDVPWMGAIRQQLLTDAIEFYEGFVVERPDDPQIALESAYTLSTLRELYGQAERYEDVMAAVQREQELLEQVLAARPGDVAAERRLADTWVAEGSLAMVTGRLAEALDHFAAALAGFESLDLSDPETRRLRAYAYGQHARALYTAGRLDDGRAAIEASIEDLRSLIAEADFGSESAHDLARMLDMLCTNVRQSARVAGQEERRDAALRAIAYGEESVALLEAILANDSDDPRAMLQLGRSLQDVAVAMTDLERFEEAGENLQAASEVLRRVVREQPHIVKGRAELGQVLANLAGIYSERGEADGALELIEESVALLEEVVRLQPDSVDWQRALAAGLTNRSVALFGQDRIEEGLGAARRAQEVARVALAQAPSEPALLTIMVFTALGSATELRDAGRPLEAVEALGTARDCPLSPYHEWLCANILADCIVLSRDDPDVDLGTLDAWELEAIDHLDRALATGGTSIELLREDPSNASLRELESIRARIGE